MNDKRKVRLQNSIYAVQYYVSQDVLATGVRVFQIVACCVMFIIFFLNDTLYILLIVMFCDTFIDFNRFCHALTL